MKSFRVGTISGIPIYINLTLLLFLPVIGWLITRPDQLGFYAALVSLLSPYTIDPAALATNGGLLFVGVVGALGLFAGVLLHELGHALTARRFRVETSMITLWIFGGLAHIKELPENWDAEFWIALAGPVTSVLLGVACLVSLRFVPESLPMVAFVLGWLGLVNLTLAVFNMIPAFPMDGGRILRALLARSRPYVVATSIATSVAKVFALFMAIFGVFTFNVILVLVAMFVYVAATSESRTTVVRELLRGVKVSDLMTREVKTIDAELTIAELVDRMLAERHTGYPVVDRDGDILGLATIDHVRSVPAHERYFKSVRDVMDREPATIDADADAFDVLMRFSENRTNRALVTEDDRLIGIVTQTDLTEALEVIEGIRGRDPKGLARGGFA
ncbi:site-2 protease family protein [Halobium salinum]|uniref:Zinc metalloprotease n=1 Tax=Halobium salinum TaxID=1364940 RepID=A0ABD5PC13_9EURY|nr:site-2 protease family protein [Halobium salinum]